MIRSSTSIKIVGLIVAVGLPIVLAAPVLAAPAGVSNVENFIRSVITVLAGLAGLVATGFFVAGGFTYITSSGNPEQLDKAKRTRMLPGNQPPRIGLLAIRVSSDRQFFQVAHQP